MLKAFGYIKRVVKSEENFGKDLFYIIHVQLPVYISTMVSQFWYADSLISIELSIDNYVT